MVLVVLNDPDALVVNPTVYVAYAPAMGVLGDAVTADTAEADAPGS